MDYIKQLFSCCCSKESPALKLNFQSTCCKSRSISIILTNENDIERMMSLLDEISSNRCLAFDLRNAGVFSNANDIQKVQHIRGLQNSKITEV